MFGLSVDLDGNRALIGSSKDGGKMHHYEWDGNNWNEIGRFGSTGFAVALEGNRAFVGSTHSVASGT